VGNCGLDESASEQGLLAGPCEHSNELQGTIKGEEIFDQLSDY
jgi:hypothetical protein